jgi:outer membrane lipoprotein carrier protein
MIHLVLGFALLGQGTLPPAQDTLARGVEIAQRASTTYQQLSSFQADFQQVIDDSMLGTFRSRGRLIQAGTSRLAMRFTDPAGEAIVLDGQRVWVYTPSTTPGQVLRLPIPSGPTFGPNVLAWLLDHPAERYDISYLRSESLDGLTLDVIALAPRDPDLPFTRAVLWIDRANALPRRVEIKERTGADRTLGLSRIRTNVPVTDATFRFEVPPGVRIVDQ